MCHYIVQSRFYRDPICSYRFSGRDTILRYLSHWVDRSEDFVIISGRYGSILSYSVVQRISAILFYSAPPMKRYYPQAHIVCVLVLILSVSVRAQNGPAAPANSGTFGLPSFGNTPQTDGTESHGNARSAAHTLPGKPVTTPPTTLSGGDLLSVLPDTLDLNTGLVGLSRLNSFSVSNKGVDSLTVVEIAFISKNEDYRIISPEVPFGIPAGTSVQVDLQFLPHDSGCTQQRIVVRTATASDTITLLQCSIVQPLSADFDTVYTLSFPSTDANTCSQKTLEIRLPDIETGGVKIYGIYPQDSQNDYFNYTLTIPYSGQLLSPVGGNAFPFEFCPRQEGSFSRRFRCVSNMGVFIIETTGTTFPQAQPEVSHRYYLNTVLGNVGEPVEMELIAEPPLTVDDRVDSIAISLTFDRKSLVLENVAYPEFPVPNTTTLHRTRLTSGAEMIVMKSSNGFLNGEALLTLQFIGLSTAQPTNVVALAGGTTLNADSLFTDGYIYLEGCTLGASGFSRRVTVESIGIDPSGNQIIIRYTSPDGATGNASVIDAAGAQTLRLELQAGTGTPQELRLPLDGFFPGLYGLMIEVADDRVILPFISPR